MFIITLCAVLALFVIFFISALLAEKLIDPRSQQLRKTEFKGSTGFFTRSRIPSAILEKDFVTFSSDQLRYCKNLRIIESEKHMIWIFDFEQTSKSGIQPTTIIAISQAPLKTGDLSLLTFKLPAYDPLADRGENESTWLRKSTSETDIAAETSKTKRFHYIKNPGKYNLNGGWKVDEWLKRNSEINIEFRKDVLLTYKTNFLIDPELITSAIEHVYELVSASR